MDVYQAKMTEFIKNNTFTTAHVATEVVCLAGLLYYTVQSNRKMSKTIQSLEMRLINCENVIQQQSNKLNQLQFNTQQKPSVNQQRRHQQPGHVQQRVFQARPDSTIQTQQKQPSHQSFQQPIQQSGKRLPVIYEEPTPILTQYEDDSVIPDISEEELDNEINEELGKLVDFATEA